MYLAQLASTAHVTAGLPIVTLQPLVGGLQVDRSNPPRAVLPITSSWFRGVSRQDNIQAMQFMNCLHSIQPC